MSSRSTVAVLLGVALTSLSGCAPAWVDAPKREAKLDLPQQFAASGAVGAPGAATPVGAAENPSLGRVDWHRFFDDPHLGGLCDLALKQNRELDIRLQEVVIARAEVGAARGEVLPKVSAGAVVGGERAGRYTSRGASDEAIGLPANLGDFGFGLQASWEVDVWGKLRTAVKAAQLRVRASVAARNFVQTEIVAEIARSYYELAALDQQLEVMAKMIALQEQALQMLRAEKIAARTTQLAVWRFEAELAKNRARVFDLEQARVQAENRINFLVGRLPQPVERDAAALDKPLPSAVQSGLPADLLDNRPDVQQAKLGLQAAELDIRVARARFYPSLSIDAELGYRAFAPQHLLATPASIVGNLAGNLVAPLINRAGIAADYRRASATQVQAVLTYEQTLLRAFTEVVNRLARLKNLQRRYALQQVQVDALGHAAEASALLYQSARADYMEVLLTRREWLDAQLELIETRMRLRATLVDLYQALGGGWR